MLLAPGDRAVPKDVVARYDGHADWYDGWAQTGGADAMKAARAALEELVPEGPGLAVDLGCGTGLQAATVTQRGYHVVGVDVSADQLRLASRRLAVVRADARRLPLPDRCAQLVFSVLTHTDVEDFGALVAEAVRILVPGGALVYVGVHPCFVHPAAESLPNGLRLHRGYRRSGWQPTTPFTGAAVRARVGVHHLPLETLLRALIGSGARLDHVLERGGDAFPMLLAARLTRAN